MDEDVFDGEAGDFSDEDPAEGVGYGGVEGEEGEGGFVGGVLVELNCEILREDVLEKRVWWREKWERTLANFSSDQAWSSPG